MQGEGFRIVEKNGVKVFKSLQIESIGYFEHFFSTRVGGQSTGSYNSLNLGVFTDDEKENITENFKRVFNAFGMEDSETVYLKQVHSDTFYVVDSDNFKKVKNSQGDAIITTSKKIAIGIFTADCIPITAVDRKGSAAAVIHAGWKGTNLNIAGKVINHMVNCMGIEKEDILVSLGPGIGPCCFEVNCDVADKFKNVIVRNGKHYVNLFKENIEHLINSGISEKNINSINLCTYCNKELFYSYRRDNKKTGRIGTFIMLK